MLLLKSKTQTDPNRHNKISMPLIDKVVHLNQGQLVGGDVEGVDVGGKAGVGLLGAVRAVWLLDVRS